MAINHHVEDISFSPLRKDISNYSWESLRQDAIAGLSVALLTVPQAMAYALLAGLPISCGFFAAIYFLLSAPRYLGHRDTWLWGLAMQLRS